MSGNPNGFNGSDDPKSHGSIASGIIRPQPGPSGVQWYDRPQSELRSPSQMAQNSEPPQQKLPLEQAQRKLREQGRVDAAGRLPADIEDFVGALSCMRAQNVWEPSAGCPLVEKYIRRGGDPWLMVAFRGFDKTPPQTYKRLSRKTRHPLRNHLPPLQHPCIRLLTTRILRKISATWTLHLSP